MIEDRQRIVNELATRLNNAARASVAAGAQYDPSETITFNAKDSWNHVADLLVAMVEAMVKHKGELDVTD